MYRIIIKKKAKNFIDKLPINEKKIVFLCFFMYVRAVDRMHVWMSYLCEPTLWRQEANVRNHSSSHMIQTDEGTNCNPSTRETEAGRSW